MCYTQRNRNEVDCDEAQNIPQAIMGLGLDFNIPDLYEK